VIEDDLPESYRDARGYCGHMARLRELFEQKTTGVTAALKTPLDQLPGFHCEEAEDGTYTMTTLGIQPFDLGKTDKRKYRLGDLPSCSAWEVELEADIEGCEAVGLELKHKEGMYFASYTSVFTETQSRVYKNHILPRSRAPSRRSHTIYL
jgi:hypothetical protein